MPTKITNAIMAMLALWGGTAAAQHVGAPQRTGGEAWRTRSTLVGVGHVSMLDTYLSPEKYRGTELMVMTVSRREKDSTAWVRQTTHEGHVAMADNRSGNGGEMAGQYQLRLAMMRRWRTTVAGHPMQLMAGGTAHLQLGFVYNTRGSNNPAQARLALDIEPTVAADLYLGRPSHTAAPAPSPGGCARYPMALHYEVSAPMCGVRFSPNYGQSYYEIFSRGNYDHNIVPTTFVATPSVRHMLTLDVRWLRTVWRIGYVGDFTQQNVNRIKQHSYTHAFVIGVTKTLH